MGAAQQRDSFGWVATYPTGGSSETCAISSAIRLALELSAAGYPEYLDDVERFVRNQVVEAQFKDLAAYHARHQPPRPLLLGCFDSQSMPNGHLGTRGGEDVGTVEGCCLKAACGRWPWPGTPSRAADETGLTVNLALSRNGPAGEVIGYQPFEGRVDVIPRAAGAVRIRLPRWVATLGLRARKRRARCEWRMESRTCVLVVPVRAGARVSVRYPLREFEEEVPPAAEHSTCGGKATWSSASTRPAARADLPCKWRGRPACLPGTPSRSCPAPPSPILTNSRTPRAWQ